ncbi:Flp pilus assembly protein CpaB [Alkalicella caledoniensis]|uniref:Flp pilus assembly protein CpaB n=1 Tax=Alkalicella caledoniensis TaxID=2731377 RepID=A0A7G9W7D8_ALKCA|nr:Flp pilus assembly protein CpaB [Alkalicella caledoniensis]QNO14600.1 Flp pilus assembly protein CpaB [Alkalicella caledoniensis]
MKGTVRKLILISFILAILAAGAIYMYLQSFSAPSNSENMRKVYVATETIPPRTRVDRAMLKEIHVPDESILNQYISDSEAIVGKYTKETIFVNEGFLSSKLIDKHQGDMSFRIPPGHRAVSINLTGSSGVSYLLKPLDNVDVIVFLNQSIANQDVSKILLQNLTVLAVDQIVNRDESKNVDNIPGNFLVTLSVPNKDVEKLVLAENIGNLKLSLRPVDENSNSPSKVTNWRDLTSQSGNSIVEDDE